MKLVAGVLAVLIVPRLLIAVTDAGGWTRAAAGLVVFVVGFGWLVREVGWLPERGDDDADA